MAQPICPKCGGNFFLSSPATFTIPNGVYLIYCGNCGCVVGVVSSK